MDIELKKEAYLLGFFIGDGHASLKEKKELRFFIEPQLFREIKRLLRETFKNAKITSYRYKNKKCYEIRVRGKEVESFREKFNIKGGKKENYIQEVLKNFPKDDSSTLSIVAGLIDSDGCIWGRKAIITTKINEIKDFLSQTIKDSHIYLNQGKYWKIRFPFQQFLDLSIKLRNLPPSKGSDGETLRCRTIELIRQNVNTSKQISERIGLSKRRVNEILLSLFKEGIVNRVRNNRNESFVYFLTSESTKGES